MRNREKGSALTRREFVALVATGSAAVLASPLSAATGAPPAERPAAHRTAAAPVMSAADRKEFERQRKSTLETVEVLRKHKMGPGTEMASVFRPIPSSRRSG